MSWVHHTIITPSWISAKKDLNFKGEFCDSRRALGLCWQPFKILNPKVGGGGAAFVLQSKNNKHANSSVLPTHTEDDHTDRSLQSQS